jgi:uncharacterized membrane protein YedE/YeeE
LKCYTNTLALSIFAFVILNRSSRLGIGRRADNLALCKNTVVTKSKGVKLGSNLAEPSKEGCGSKMAVLPMLVMMFAGQIIARLQGLSKSPGRSIRATTIHIEAFLLNCHIVKITVSQSTEGRQ